MDKKIYDLIILGAGPAGLAASIYAARAELDAVVIEKEPVSGGQIINTYEIDNYPGLPQLSGLTLGEKFREHSDMLGAKHIYGEVVEFLVDGKVKKVRLENGEELSAKTVIIATGAKNRKLGVKGEEELTGMGVSYCATCDGAFFKNRVVAVVGGGDVAVEDAIFLARMCKQVYVIHRREEFRAAKTLCSRLMSLDNVTVCWNQVVEEIQGEDQVMGVLVKNVKDGNEKELMVDGVFIAVGTMPNSELFRSSVMTDDLGYLKADETCKTNIPGVYAAGDVRTKLLRQVVTAAADGACAVTSAERYLYEEDN